MISRRGVTPDFYLPNSSESGKSDILLDFARSRSGQFHEFKLQLEDLKRHVSILGMTGGGKSNTSSVIVQQVAKMGLPIMVMDWHNETENIALRG